MINKFFITKPGTTFYARFLHETGKDPVQIAGNFGPTANDLLHIASGVDFLEATEHAYSASFPGIQVARARVGFGAPGISQECYQGGHSGVPRHGYNVGPSAWGEEKD
jgi:hypothetical protein